MKYIFIVILLTSISFSQVKDFNKLSLILKKVKVTDFRYPEKFDKDLIELIPDSVKNGLKLMLLKDSIPENSEKAWNKGLLDAKDSLEENKPTIIGYGLGTIIMMDSLKEGWSVDKVKAYIYSKEFGVIVLDKYGCQILQQQKAYIEGFNKLIHYVLQKYYGLDINKFADKNVTEFIIKYGSQHKDWLINN